MGRSREPSAGVGAAPENLKKLDAISCNLAYIFGIRMASDIASNFSTFLWGGPRLPACARAFGAQFGASPPYRPPLSKIPGSAPVAVKYKHERFWSTVYLLYTLMMAFTCRATKDLLTY